MIEASQRCTWCRLPFEDSPSDYFCSEKCERNWIAHANRVDELPPRRLNPARMWGWGG